MGSESFCREAVSAVPCGAAGSANAAKKPAVSADAAEKFCREILSAISRGRVSGKAELNSLKLEIAKKFRLPSLPTDPDILMHAKKPSPRLRALLSIKPVRSLSGVAVVAVMVKPHKCPGSCIYCPSGIGREMPKSYTGREPAALRALEFNFDPFLQARNRIEQLELTGHSTGKIELIVMGGTFLSTPKAYQDSFVKGALDAIAGGKQKSSTLTQAKKTAERSVRRVVGITYETRPDFCSKHEINRVLSLGGTRVELGVQMPDDAIYGKIKRGHTVKDVVLATSRLKDSALKVCCHIMPGLPGSTPENDLSRFKELFSNPDFRPDMLKFYPCLVMEGTELHKEWRAGNYEPLETQEAAELVAEMKSFIPPYCRVMRIQRDIPSNLVSAGVKKSNLRQLAAEAAKRKGVKCRCIRCREAGLTSYLRGKNAGTETAGTERGAGSAAAARGAKISHLEYEASRGTEIFISADDEKRDLLFGFCRLRIPVAPFRPEITARTALVRELRVYGEALPLGIRKAGAFQHAGLGKKLLADAEETARSQFGMNKMLILSGLGVRPYYRGLGYRAKGVYMGKALRQN
ncbi:MAG: tRNA uridine(34) 5-carboxymethylaminomethyl modification radical SAM/GNAT enzyme Elp3 [Candidatus Diapherotrites archaeon]